MTRDRGRGRDRRRRRRRRGRVTEQDGHYICSECRRGVDQFARTCPHCDAILKPRRDIVQKVIIALGALGTLVSLGLYLFATFVRDPFEGQIALGLFVVTVAVVIGGFALYYVMAIVIGVLITVYESVRDVGRTVSHLFR